MVQGTGAWGFAQPSCTAIWLALFFVLSLSLKGKDVPTLLQDCTSLCPDNHETAWETEILSPCPLPPLEKKMLDRAGFVPEPGQSKDWREFLFSGAVGCLDFWRFIFISKVTKAVLSEGGLRPRLCFLTNAKTNKQMPMPIAGPQTTSLMATVCSALDLGHLLNLGWAQSENKLQGSSFFFFLQTTRHPLPIFHAASWGIIRSGTKMITYHCR